MDVFKLNIDSKNVYKITKFNLEYHTNMDRPWLQIYNNQKSWFAVCPICNNPIQIIGLSVDSKIQPYGKHFIPKTPLTYPINGVVDIDEREYCQYFTGRKTITKDTKRPPDNPIAKAIIEVLIEHFDRVIYILEKTSGVKISEALASDMLLEYEIAEGWRYRGATLDNIPWVFAYMSSKARALLGRKILNDKMSESLMNVFKQNNIELHFESGYLRSKAKQFTKLTFSYMHHSQQIVENVLQESIDFVVAYNQNRIYAKSISFEHEYFRNLINSKHNNHNKRNQKLINLATSILQK